jgi:ribulose-phosphate 3-epimerase
VDVSLWSADLARLGEEIARMDGHADLYHFDVSDAHFVPGLLFFPDLLAAVRPLTRRPFTVHLMSRDPLPLIDDFVDAGAGLLLVHAEIGGRAADALRAIDAKGRARGLALCLETPIDALEPLLDQVDMVLLMGTRLGVKGQALSPLAAGRIEALRALLSARGLEGRVRIEADGGIRESTVPLLRRAGADLVVPGSLVFSSSDLQRTVSWLRGL